MFDQIDKEREEGEKGPQEAYEQLKKLHDESESKDDFELLWRLARACYDLALTFEEKNPKKKELFKEGQTYAVQAFNLKSDEFQTAKWAAALTGQLTEYLGTKEKIEKGNDFKKYLDKALSIKPEDHTVLHMRGRFSFNVAGLSWIERKVASTLFATPPVATYDEAISDFLAVEKLRDDWMENRMYLARSYLAKNEKQSAVKYLKLVQEMGVHDESDKAVMEEATALLKKHDK